MKASRLLRVAAKSVFALVDPLFGPFPGPRILIYHQVGTDFGREMEVPTETFRRQLDWMQQHGEIVDLETAIERREEPDADKLFVLTFDDGFEDVYHNAFPLMKERGIPFTLYLTTHPIETGEPLDPRYPEAKPLTWDQVNEMIGTGLVTLGAHTHTHPDLRMVDAETIHRELETSNRLIEDRTGIVPRHFTYPWGWWSEQADPLVRERYEMATVGSRPGRLQGLSDLHRFARIPLQASDSTFSFRRRLLTGAPTESVVRDGLDARRRLNGVHATETVVFVSVTHGIGGPTRSLLTLLERLGGTVRRELVVHESVFAAMVRDRAAAEAIHSMPKWKRLERLSRVAAALDFLFWLLPRRSRVRCIHANGHAEVNVAGPATVLLRIPMVLWAHAHESSPSVDLLGRLWRRLLPDFQIAAVSEDARSVVLASGLAEARDDVNIVPNPIGPDVVASEPRSSKETITIGFLRGRSAASGFTLVPDVVQALSSRNIRWLLFTVPPKPDEAPDVLDAWDRLEPHLGIRVEMRGKIPDVSSAYAECDIVFCPSLIESFGRVAAEAMLNGLPVVASDIPPLRRLVGDDQAGILFPPGDVGAAASAIGRLAEDREERDRLGEEGQRRAAEFSPERVAEAFKLMYMGGSSSNERISSHSREGEQHDVR